VTLKVARRKYRKFVEEGIKARPIWEDLRSQILLGDDGFVDLFTDIVRSQKQSLYGYSQKSVADHLKLHYSRVSRILAREEAKSAKGKI
jgi:hypothetical protein